ncbi:hypothetical protein F4778DRAFT_306719 [Xylariomycetidae sp. FL2044]|nr:hypothetical protein F4778DRAFT_306719 [Xylariomycetidae sp. FL2044]
MTMTYSGGFPFFDLPAELRSAILTHLLVSDYGVILHNQTFLQEPAMLDIFLVNLQMYQEASAIFYTQNRFIVNAQSHRLPVHLVGSGGFLSQEGQDARRRVRALTLMLTRVGGEFGSTLGPTVSDMVLCGSLRELKLCIGQPPSLHPSRRVPDLDMVSRAPFQALLTLLADPDLAKVELSVWKVHWAVLCPFHRKEASGHDERVPSSEAVDDHGLATLHGGSDWVDLDWRALVETYGNVQHIVRIGERGY